MVGTGGSSLPEALEAATEPAEQRRANAAAASRRRGNPAGWSHAPRATTRLRCRNPSAAATFYDAHVAAKSIAAR